MTGAVPHIAVAAPALYTAHRTLLMASSVRQTQTHRREESVVTVALRKWKRSFFLLHRKKRKRRPTCLFARRKIFKRGRLLFICRTFSLLYSAIIKVHSVALILFSIHFLYFPYFLHYKASREDFSQPRLSFFTRLSSFPPAHLTVKNFSRGGISSLSLFLPLFFFRQGQNPVNTQAKESTTKSFAS